MVKKKRQTDMPQKKCGNPKCGELSHVRTRKCPHCDYEFPRKVATGLQAGNPDEAWDSREKQQLAGSIGFMLRHLDEVRNTVHETPVKMQQILNAPEDEQLELLKKVKLQKELKAHKSVIGDAYVDKLLGLLKSILKKGAEDE